MAFTFYRDVFGGWRWECRGHDGHVQDSQHSYATRDECVAAASSATLQNAPAAEQPLREPLLLCIQSDAACREAMQEALPGFRTVLATHSLDAIRLVSSTVFDAYILDYVLPGSSGVHLCRHIRRTDRYTPICFYAAEGTEEQRKRAFRAGANAYVCAAAGPDALRQEIQALLDSAENRSLRARVEEERAIQDELERRVIVAINQAEHARALAAEATERAAKTRARERFIAAGGTPAHFQRWWPELYVSVSSTRSSERSASGE
jgi:DNA-binding response OmpR family regulator